MKKNSALAAGLKAAAHGHGGEAALATTPRPARATGSRQRPTVLIGGHFAPEVRRALLLVQAEPQNEGKNLKQLLGEAINDLCVKYRKPQPYGGEA
jgi:hypothetical protein